jgi:hypothetical protein
MARFRQKFAHTSQRSCRSKWASNHLFLNRSIDASSGPHA